LSQDRSFPSEIFVGLGDDTIDPVCDLAKRIKVAFCGQLRFVYVVEILEKIKIIGLCGPWNSPLVR
jgi:hypothetical protein